MEVRRKGKMGVARLPLELAIIEDQIRLGVIRFRMRIEVWHRSEPGGRTQGVWRHLKRGYSVWEVGSVEELLAAIKVAELGLSRSPGVMTHTHVRCERCGQWTGKRHTAAACDGAMEFKRGVLAKMGTEAIMGRKEGSDGD